MSGPWREPCRNRPGVRRWPHAASANGGERSGEGARLFGRTSSGIEAAGRKVRYYGAAATSFSGSLAPHLARGKSRRIIAAWRSKMSAPLTQPIERETPLGYERLEEALRMSRLLQGDPQLSAKLAVLIDRYSKQIPLWALQIVVSSDQYGRIDFGVCDVRLEERVGLVGERLQP